MKVKNRLLISLFNRCQYKCSFCVYLRKQYPSTLNTKQWVSVIRKARKSGFEVLEIGGQGEPALHPGFSAIVNEAFRLGYRIEVLSNIQNEKPLLRILSKISLLTINLNATEEAEFQKIHRSGNKDALKKSLTNMTAIINAIERRNLSAKARINYILTRDTILKSLLFPKQINEVLSRSTGLKRPVYVQYHHMLLTPDNIPLLPDKDLLGRFLQLSRSSKNSKHLLRHTNLSEFIKTTENVIKFMGLLSPLSRDSAPGTARYPLVKNMAKVYGCDCYKNNLFVDSNGDVFGCFNPTRILYGLPKTHDPFYYGNLLKEPLARIGRQQPPKGSRMDFSSKFWKACVLCGIKKINDGSPDKP